MRNRPLLTLHSFGAKATNRQRRTLIQGFLALALVLISCDVSTLVAPAPQVTALPPAAIDTIVVMTAQAASTQTAALVPPTLTPTLTPLPTRTPSETPTPTPTFLFLLATLTRTPKTPTLGPPSKDLSCSLSNQTPGDGAVMSKNQSFSVTWTVQNTGSGTWDSNSIDFAYASGAKLSSSKLLDLPKSVAPGESVKLTVNMVAPGSADTYKTVWALESGKNTFCRLDLTIKVK